MRHNIHLEGYAFRLRPISDADAQFVLDLRCDPELARFIHSTPPRLSDQLAWLTEDMLKASTRTGGIAARLK